MKILISGLTTRICSNEFLIFPYKNESEEVINEENLLALLFCFISYVLALMSFLSIMLDGDIGCLVYRPLGSFIS